MKTLILLSLSLLAYTFCCGQVVTNLRIADTRDVDDLPSFNKQSLRIDFKARATIGVPGTGRYSGNITFSPWADASGGLNHQLNFNDGGIYYRQGSFAETQWREWKKLMVVNADGSVPGKLDVNGTIRAKEVKIEATGWSDFVFDKHYALPSLTDVESYIEENSHLSGIPSEQEVLEQGINVAEMQAKLLQKIEELTLYVIDLKKENEEQNKLIRELQEKQ